MNKPDFNTNIMTTVQARENFSDLINHAAYGNKNMILTRRGKPLCVVISIDTYRKLYNIEKG